MILGAPTMANDQLQGALRVLLPGTDLTASCEHHHDHDDHLDLSDCSSEASSSEQTPDSKHRQPVLLAKTQLGIAQAVRIFGGVIIGTGAEEISRSWGQLSDPTFSTPDSGGESDPGYEPFVESFDLSDPSSHQLSGKAPFPDPECSKGLEGDDIGRVSDSSSDRTLPERPVGGLKRKLHSFVEDDSPGVVVTGDATPRAPGGRAAARAKAEGQGCTSFVSECGLPTDKGRFRLRAYRYHGSDKSHEPVVMVAGKVRGREGVPVRVHDQCQTSEVRAAGGEGGIYIMLYLVPGMFLFGLLTRLRARGGLGKGLCPPVFAARRSVRYAANCERAPCCVLYYNLRLLGVLSIWRT